MSFFLPSFQKDAKCGFVLTMSNHPGIWKPPFYIECYLVIQKGSSRESVAVSGKETDVPW